MLEMDFKFSSTEGYFGEGVFDNTSEYKLYNQEHFFSVLKKKYRKTQYLKSGKFPKYWNYDFLKIHNCVIKSSVVIDKKIFDTLCFFSTCVGNNVVNYTDAHISMVK